MFENITAEYLLEESLALVSDKLDKREGAIIYDTLAPFCNELARAYADLELALRQAFPQTAAREYLLLIAQQRGFKPKEATALEIKAHFNTEIPIGARFNMQEYNYTAEESLGDGMYRLVCETLGSAPNSAMGTLTPVNYIQGLTECSVESIISPGVDEESTEEFRARFLEAVSETQAFGGNAADYRAKLKAIDGVGQVKVFAADDWNGAGTVGICITDENGAPVSNPFLGKVQDMVDPMPKGKGLGLAPIGHIVDVSSVKTKKADVTLSLIAASGTDEEWLINEIKKVVNEYFAERNAGWEDRAVTAYGSGIIARVMDIEGVVDITTSVIDGRISITCADNEIIAAKNTEVTVNYV